MSVASGWYPDPAGISQLRFWDGQSWTTATASPPVMQAAPSVVQTLPVPDVLPVAEVLPGGYDPQPPKRPRRGTRLQFAIAGVAVLALAGAIVAEVATRPHHDDSSAVPNAVSPEQHFIKYDAVTRADVKRASIAEETYYTDNNIYTTDGPGAPGSMTGPLKGFQKSSDTTSITFSLVDTRSYMIVALSRSGRAFCFNSLRSGAGVVEAATC